MTTQPAIARAVVFDKNTGDIVHVHSIFTFPGAAAPTGDELVAEARVKAGKATGRADATLDVLHIRHDEIAHGHHYRVKLPERKLVGTPVAQPRKPSKT